MKQAEKALRDAGWEQVTRSDVEPGEEYYDLQAGWVTKAGRALDGVPMPNYPVLRAPRPEPKYEHGTVARVKVLATGREFNAIWGPFDSWYAGCGYLVGDVEVLRVIAYPDGSTPGESVTTKGVTRVEVIDDTGLACLNTAAGDVEVELHDDGRTLKVFTGGTDERFLEMANELLAHLKPHGKDNTK